VSEKKETFTLEKKELVKEGDHIVRRMATVNFDKDTKEQGQRTILKNQNLHEWSSNIVSR